MTPTNLPKLRAILERVKSAPKGPWSKNASLYTDARVWIEPLDCGLVLKAEDKVLYGQMGELANLIANAPTDLTLLAECVSDAVPLLEEFNRQHVPEGTQGDCRTCDYDFYIYKKHDADCLMVRLNHTLTKIKSKLGAE
jgi:hypothetical protein